MAFTDRAFRALARASPENVIAFLRITAREIPWSAEASTVLDDPNLDTPPHPRAADLVLRVGEPDLHHVECQGYRDPTFLDRLFDYHLMLVLRHPERHVRTIALWTRVPPSHHRATAIVRGDVTIRIRTVVLPEIPAPLLLADPATACFAAGADLAGMTAEELCARVATVMASGDPTFEQKYMAAMVAASQGRYPLLVRAMEKSNMQPVIIEDLVDYGFDQGVAEGIEKGVERGRLDALRATLLDVLEARGLVPEDRHRALIAHETDLARLRSWCRRAATASAIEAALD